MITAFFKKTDPFRFRYLAGLAVLFLVINMALRFSLQIAFASALPFSTSMVPGLVKGFLNDCAALVFVLLPPATLLLLPTGRFLRRPAGIIYALLIIFIFSSIFIFAAAAEYFFWGEFNSRFNFIAVDYLIYTTEVIRNIVESYPLARLFMAVFILAGASTALLWKKLRGGWPRISAHPANHSPGGLAGRLVTLGGFYALAVLVFCFFAPFTGDRNRFWNEYAKNGVYELFSAYLHNQLDYTAFYKTMDKQEALSLAQSEITDTGGAFEPLREGTLLRLVAARIPEKKPNVIIVIMESMGHKEIGEHTPNLNRLAESGLSFTNMQSTGTRTVRGLEAVMLSVPPTPGNSIVRRPDNDKLFSLGTLFRDRGYDRDFIYGGYGYFDNMNAFFAGNGYSVTDRLGFAAQNKTFANAWGQCDEDLFSESLSRADASFSAGRPFNQVLLTTSNHRPFTYPDGKIDMAPGSRIAAIHYADYAIGNFMREAKEKPWFSNTVFVFVGDHPASIAGKTEIPANAYGIVCLMYGPNFFRPEKVAALCSQIDIAPTLLASLGWEYVSQFFGANARELPARAGRAWISTYQLLGFRTNDRLVILKPDKSVEITSLDQASVEAGDNSAAGEDQALVARAIASYQCAYDLFTAGGMKESLVLAFRP